MEQENVTEEEDIGTFLHRSFDNRNTGAPAASHPVDTSPGHIIHKKDYDSMIQKKNTAKVRIIIAGSMDTPKHVTLFSIQSTWRTCCPR